MNRKILAATAVIAGLAAVSSMGFRSVPSAAGSPVTASGPVAPAASDAGSARAGSWTFEGEADRRDSGALELNIRSVAPVPSAFDLVRRLLVGRDVLLVNTGAPVVDVTGRALAVPRLDDAILRVKGTLLPAGQWRYDLDGEATPTFRVSRIVLLAID